MSNPIPASVRGWLYVAGIIIGASVAVILPDLLTALGAGETWQALAVRACGAVTAVLAMLSRANLGDAIPSRADISDPTVQG